MAKSGTLLTALVILLGTGALSSAQQRPDLVQQRYRISIPVRDYDICLVNQTGWMRCTRKQQVRERLAAHLTARESRLVIDAIDDINGATGNSRESDILVHCMGGWLGARATAMPALQTGPAGRTREASALEGRIAQARRDAVRSACTSGRRTGTPGSDSAYERQARSDVAGFDAAIAGCQDRIRPVAYRPASETGRTGNPRGTSTLGNEPGDFERRRSRGRTEDSRGTSTLGNEPDDFDGSAPGGGEDITGSLMFQLGRTKAAEAQERQERESSSAARQRADQLEALEKAEQSSEQAEAEAERPAEEQAAGQCLVDGQCTEPAPAASRPLPPGIEGGGSTCAERQARWNAFERRCDGSQWRSWECVAFRRLLNGCTDIRRIRPGPDGDLTCPSPAPSDREASRVAQRCGRIRLIGRLTPDGAFYCGRLPVARPGARPGLSIDICRDPRILPHSDLRILPHSDQRALPNSDQCP